MTIESLTERVPFRGERTAGVVSTGLQCRGMVANGTAHLYHPDRMSRDQLLELASVIADLLAE